MVISIVKNMIAWASIKKGELKAAIELKLQLMKTICFIVQMKCLEREPNFQTFTTLLNRLISFSLLFLYIQNTYYLNSHNEIIHQIPIPIDYTLTQITFGFDHETTRLEKMNK